MKKLIPWLLAAIVFQLCIYLYLDRVLLVPAVSGVTVTPTISDTSGIVSKWPSFDGSYRAEVSKDWVKIYSVAGNSLVKEVDIGDTEKLSYFSWLPDRDIALAGISEPGSKGTTVVLKPLNMITDSQPIEPTIAGLAKDAEIANVAFSPDINVVYIQVKSGNTSAIYRDDANNRLTRVSNTPALIGRIANLKSEDALLYDSINTGRVYLVDKDGRRQLSPDDGSQYALIGTDKNDNIYIAQLSTTTSRSAAGEAQDERTSGSTSVARQAAHPAARQVARPAAAGWRMPSWWALRTETSRRCHRRGSPTP